MGDPLVFPVADFQDFVLQPDAISDVAQKNGGAFELDILPELVGVH